MMAILPWAFALLLTSVRGYVAERQDSSESTPSTTPSSSATPTTPVSSGTDFFSIVYPVFTPTVNYIDDVVIAWETEGAYTTGAIFCNEGSVGFWVTPTAPPASGTYSLEMPMLGYSFQQSSYVTSFPATCSVTMFLGEIGTDGIQASNQGTAPTGGTIIITSFGNTDGAQTEWAISTTKGIVSSPTSNTHTTTTTTSKLPGITKLVTQTAAPSSGLSTGAIAGIAVGAVVAAGLLAGLFIWLYLLHRRMTKWTNPNQPNNNDNNMGHNEQMGIPMEPSPDSHMYHPTPETQMYQTSVDQRMFAGNYPGNYANNYPANAPGTELDGSTKYEARDSLLGANMNEPHQIHSPDVQGLQHADLAVHELPTARNVDELP